MEYIVGFFILLIFVIVVPAILVFGGFTDDPQKNRHATNTYQDSEDEEEYNLYGTLKSEKEKRIEAKRKQVAELEKVSDWQRHYDPSFDMESYTWNNWDDEEKKLDHKIGNLKQQNISYGGWIDYEDRRTYKDENDPTEDSEDW